MDAVVLGRQRQVGVAAGDVAVAPCPAAYSVARRSMSWLFRCHRFEIRRIHRAARWGIHFWMK